MTTEQQLRLQAYLDGELPPDQAQTTASWLAGDAEATSLLTELRHTRQALRAGEPEFRLPESREFYWSKIARDIRLLEVEPLPVHPTWGWAWLGRWMVPASALVLVCVASVMTYKQLHLGRVTEVDLAVADASAFTFRDYSAGMTLVWLPFPAENELAQNEAPDTIH